MQSHTPVNGKTMAACTSGIVAAREQDILALQRKLANKAYNPQKTDTTTRTHTQHGHAARTIGLCSCRSSCLHKLHTKEAQRNMGREEENINMCVCMYNHFFHSVVARDEQNLPSAGIVQLYTTLHLKTWNLASNNCVFIWHLKKQRKWQIICLKKKHSFFHCQVGT